MYMSTFYAQKVIPKKSHLTYTRVTHKDMTQAIQEISITIAWSLFGKPNLQNQF